MLFSTWVAQDVSDTSNVVRSLYYVILAKLELCFPEFLSLCGSWLSLDKRYISVRLEGRVATIIS